jgi:hypothetical protein
MKNMDNDNKESFDNLYKLESIRLLNDIKVLLTDIYGELKIRTK